MPKGIYPRASDINTGEKVEVKSLCGAVNLLAAIFGENKVKLKIKYGLLPPFPLCLYCQEPLITKQHQRMGFCSNKCKRNYNTLTLVCDECGVIFLREKAQILNRFRRGYKKVFHSQKCLGKRTGREYGFAKHPEHKIPPKKWDYSKVYELRDKTGWGAIRIGRALGIPSPTVSKILRGRKGEA